MSRWQDGIDAAVAVYPYEEAVEAAVAEWGRQDSSCPMPDGPCGYEVRVPFAVVPDGDGWRIVPLKVRPGFSKQGAGWRTILPDQEEDGAVVERDDAFQYEDSQRCWSRLVGPWEPS